MEYFFPEVNLPGLEKLIHSPPFLFVPGDRVGLSGELGSGKTTFTQTFLREKIPDTVRSPTYTYYSRYILPGNIPFYHFDLYRIEDALVFSQIGGDEILDDLTNICFIEWPERLPAYFSPTISIHLEKGSENGLRNITVHVHSK